MNSQLCKHMRLLRVKTYAFRDIFDIYIYASEIYLIYIYIYIYMLQRYTRFLRILHSNYRSNYSNYRTLHTEKPNFVPQSNSFIFSSIYFKLNLLFQSDRVILLKVTCKPLLSVPWKFKLAPCISTQLINVEKNVLLVLIIVGCY